MQDNCSPETGEAVKTHQVRTVCHQWCMREEQITSSKPLYNWSAVSTCHSTAAGRVFQLCTCDHSRHWRLGPSSTRTLTTKAGPVSAPAWPGILHLCYPASSWHLHPPSATHWNLFFLPQLPPPPPFQRPHQCCPSATALWAAISSTPTLRLSASSRERSHPDCSLSISHPGQPFWFITSPLDYFFCNNVPIKHPHKLFLKLPVLIATFIDYFGYGLLVSGYPNGEERACQKYKQQMLRNIWKHIW